MAKGQGKTGLIVTIVVLALTLVVVGSIVVFQNLKSEPAPVVQEEPATEDMPTQDTTETPATSDDEEVSTDGQDVDTSELRSVDIEPMSIVVYYGTSIPGGFEFQVQRANDGTQYVEFLNEDLIGTKCTDDTGIFATIVEAPSESEQATLDQSVTVGGTTYGLLLSSDSCTGDMTLLSQYQSALSEGFYALGALEE